MTVWDEVAKTGDRGSPGRTPDVVSFSGLPEAWGLAGVLAATPTVGSFAGLLVDRLTGLSPLFVVLGTAGGFLLSAAGFLRALKGWSPPGSEASQG